MGSCHAACGGAAGLAVGSVSPSPAVGLLCGVTGAVAALGPDLDHPASRGVKALWWPGWALCHLIRGLSQACGLNAHRGLSHTVLAALVVGAGVGVLTGQWLPTSDAVTLGVAVAAGWIAALAGDWVTKTSLPALWWPLDADTKGPPAWARLTTGGRVERWVVAPAALGLCVVGAWLVIAP